MSHTTKEGIEVQIGQVWKDLDKRMNDRHVKVVALEDGKAVVTRCTASGGPTVYGEVRTRLSVRRMHKHSTGWALVQGAF